MNKKLKKTVKVSFAPVFEQDYNKLLTEVEGEKKKGIQNSFNNQLLKAINRTIELLKIQPDYGIHIARKLIPKKFIEEYAINNLWKINLPDAWRLLYTLNTNRVEILTILLEVINHNEYNKLFKYKKK